MGHDRLAIGARDLAPVQRTSQHGDHAAARHPLPVLAAIVGAGLAVGLAVTVWALQGEATAAAAAGQDLARLLRFMAVMKAAAALGALALVGWRLGFGALPALTVGYLAGALVMAMAPGLIWSLAHVIAGAALFHGGLLLVLGLAYVDRGDGGWRGRLAAIARGGRC